MKQLTVIYLSLTLLMQGFNPGLRDLVRVGEMLEHLEYHSESYGDSFSEFFSKHYGAAKDEHHESNKEEQHKHERLPFNQQNSAPTVLVYFIPQIKIPSFNFSPIEGNTFNFIYQESQSTFNNHEIFQPPRNV